VNEQEFARKIVQSLEEQVEGLPASTTYRLQALRQRALASLPDQETVISVDGRGVLRGLSWPGRPLNWRWTGPVVALILLVAAYTFQQFRGGGPPDVADLEAQVLTDELPIHAYLDQGFETWLQKTKQD
jgi:hypothetical protein